MNLTTVAVPNLIAHDLVIVHPMSSMAGYVTYIEYSYSTTKGGTTAGEESALISNPWQFGKVDADYTSARVVEPVAGEGEIAFAWAPQFGTVKFCAEGSSEYVDLPASEDGKYVAPGAGKVAYLYNNVIVPQDKLPTIKAEMKSIPLVAKARRIAVYYSQIAA